MTNIPEHMDLSDNPKQGPLPLYCGMYEIISTPLHFHEHVELSLVIEGSGTEIVNGKAHRLSPGVASFMLPNHLHGIQCDAGHPILKYCCTFDINILLNTSYDSEWCSLLYKIGSQFPSFVELSSEETKWMSDIFHKLLLESNPTLPSPGRNSIICAMVLEALLRFIRAVSNVQSAETLQEPAIKQPIWPILHYLHIHYTDKVSLESLSEHFDVSVSYVSRLFKQYMGTSFLSYLHQLRIESAVNLLTSTHMSIIDIAAESGFESVRTFSRVFQNLKKVTPSEYRNTQH
ncbi:helix-turn-helix transcriptional regulator [Paenibacillus eucommiae]|uniref:AraC-like DNA-binding protein n=1 Tax=Paenibacillus eucommiae TaxID=1355755 RepID=A0ABS4IM25_9BACL|nr:AraC family transcriptional regulator [Paenibacillus eucommiae]MBP1988594.1 AraC-like DNA-binding protein [Paenibacillus eucommiae]